MLIKNKKTKPEDSLLRFGNINHPRQPGCHRIIAADP